MCADDGAQDRSFDSDGAQVIGWVDDEGHILFLGVGAELGLGRLTAGGVIDTTFGGGDGLVTWPRPVGLANPYTLAVDDSSGAILVGYSFLAGPYNHYSGAVRLDSSGVVDPTYAGDGQAELVFSDRISINATRIQSDGKLVLVGTVRDTTTVNDDPVVFRLLPNGDLDTTFAGDGIRRIIFHLGLSNPEQARGVTLSGGRVVAVGPVEVAGVYRFGTARLTSSLIFSDGFERGTTSGWGGN